MPTSRSKGVQFWFNLGISEYQKKRNAGLHNNGLKFLKSNKSFFKHKLKPWCVNEFRKCGKIVIGEMIT